MGLLKIASLEREYGNIPHLVYKDRKYSGEPPERIYITSLWSYAWEPVRRAISHYRTLYPDSTILLGGIYATLVYDHATTLGADYVHYGLINECEDLLPAYDLMPDWDASIIFASRGCIRKCGFCGVHILEGSVCRIRNTIKEFIYEPHKWIFLQDNNVLAHPNWDSIFQELIDSKKKIDINSGLDARLLTEEHVKMLAKMNIPHVRLAYDTFGLGDQVKNAVDLLKSVGFTGDDIVIYALYNFHDTPEDFRQRVTEILSWKCGVYPTKYQPVRSLKRNEFIGENWTRDKLRMVAHASSGIGTYGTFPPTNTLINHFASATTFEKAFIRVPTKHGKNNGQQMLPR